MNVIQFTVFLLALLFGSSTPAQAYNLQGLENDVSIVAVYSHLAFLGKATAQLDDDKITKLFNTFDVTVRSKIDSGMEVDKFGELVREFFSSATAIDANFSDLAFNALDGMGNYYLTFVLGAPQSGIIQSWRVISTILGQTVDEIDNKSLSKLYATFSDKINKDIASEAKQTKLQNQLDQFWQDAAEIASDFNAQCIAMLKKEVGDFIKAFNESVWKGTTFVEPGVGSGSSANGSASATSDPSTTSAPPTASSGSNASAPVSTAERTPVPSTTSATSPRMMAAKAFVGLAVGAFAVLL